MERVIVTVKRQDEAQGHDLEVPAEVEMGRLVDMVARALGWDSDSARQVAEYEVVAEPLGRALKPHESLIDADVWDGACLVFRPPGAVPVEPPEPVPPAERPDGPVSGWRSLGIELPIEGEQQEDPSADGSQSTGFAWKRID